MSLLCEFLYGGRLEITLAELSRTMSDKCDAEINTIHMRDAFRAGGIWLRNSRHERDMRQALANCG